MTSEKKHPVLLPKDEFLFEKTVGSVRFVVEWQSSSAENICDLDVILYIFDEKARFVEKLDLDSAMSNDKAIELQSDIKGGQNGSQENFLVNLPMINEKISSILVLIDGGEKNFRYARNIRIRSVQESFISLNDKEGSLMWQLMSGSLQGDDKKTLFEAQMVFEKTTQCILGAIIYRVEKRGDSSDLFGDWMCISLSSPSGVKALQEKKSLCHKHILTSVPSLRKFCTKVFPSVASICSSLSSGSLPDLKESFLENDGLAMREFTITLFHYLCVENPKILEPSEAAYTVAMLEEMFCQIDFNGDGVVDWEEFTTFCIFAGLLQLKEAEKSDNTEKATTCSDTISYVEDTGRRETGVLAGTALLSHVTYVPHTKRLLIIQKKSDVVNILSEQFQVIGTIDPIQLLPIQTNKKSNQDKIKVCSVCYIPQKELFAYSSTDYCIVICREVSVRNASTTLALYRRITHAFLHIKLCWCSSSKILCSVSANNIIFGWSTESNEPLFDMSHHTDTITAIVSLDPHGLVATSSMDKKIILWSPKSQRVKAVLRGHSRGVRILCSKGDMLLSAGFECDARTWDLVTLEQALIMRGHRALITAAEVMTCLPDCQRAITADATGEIRVWDVFVKSGFDVTKFATTINVFSVDVTQSLDRIDFLVLPHETEFSVSNFSNVIMCSASLRHFKAEAKIKEFIAPSGMCFSETNGCIITSIGSKLYKYDLYSGNHQCTYENLKDYDITYFTLDKKGRRVFVGNCHGDILVINQFSGQLVQELSVHSKDVTCIQLIKQNDVEQLITGFCDGQIRVFHILRGVPSLQHCNERAFDQGTIVSHFFPILEHGLLLAATLSKFWGLFHLVSLKRTQLFDEMYPISDLVVIGGTGAHGNPFTKNENSNSSTSGSILTLAIAISSEILIISLDVITQQRFVSHRLHVANDAFISNVAFLQSPENSVNYSTSENSTSNLGKMNLIATTDEGHIYLWDVDGCRRETWNSHGVHRSRKHSKRHKMIDRKSTCTTESSVLLNPTARWKAHADAILNLSVLSEHGCFVTNSLDGYHYVWSLQQVRLGSIPLPNLQPTMRRSEKECVAWKFVMEKILVTPSQQEFSRYILDNMDPKEGPLLRCYSEVSKSVAATVSSSHKNDSIVGSFSDLFVNVDTNNTCSDAGAHVTVLGSLNDTEPLVLHSLTTVSNDDDERSIGSAQSVSKPVNSLAIPKVRQGAKSLSQLTSPVSVARDSDHLHSPIKMDEQGSIGSFLSPPRPKTSSTLCSTPEGASRVTDKHESWYSSSDISKNVVAPFSDISISRGKYDGYIGCEEERVLKRIFRDKGRAEGYSRLEPQLMLKNPNLSTSVKFPDVEVSQSEINFGSQRNMYKNANKVLSSRTGLSSYQNKNVKHSICRSRIEYNVNHIGSMIREVPVKHDDVALPDLQATEVQQVPYSPVDTKLRINSERMNSLMEKMSIAEVESVPAWETRAALAKKEKQRIKRERIKKLKSGSKSFTKLTSSALEMKLCKVVEKYYRNIVGKNCDDSSSSERQEFLPLVETKKKTVLRAKHLMPSYKMVDVTNFLRIFCSIDKSFTGVLSISEWVKFFTAINSHVDERYAQSIFYEIDNNGDGVLSINELLPLIFTKANKEQLILIEEYLEHEISQQKNQINHSLTEHDLECLFEYYDVEMVGFVKVGNIRKRILEMELPKMAVEDIMLTLKNIDANEMFSEKEFVRIFKRYLNELPNKEESN